MRSQLTLVGLLNVSGKPKSLTKCTNHHQIMALCQTYAKLIYVRVKFNFLIFRYEKVNEFIAFTKNQSYFCFILVGELFGAFANYRPM